MTDDPKNMTEKKKKKTSDWRRGVRLFVSTLVVLGVVGLGVIGYRWMMKVTCERIELAGIQHADSTALLELARVDTGLVLLDIDPALVADRVRRHPWVREARAMRFPNGTLRIAVDERRPVVLVLDREGRPGHYLDRDGHAMPPVAGAVYDVPLVRGLDERYHPVRRVQNEQALELVGLLAGLSVEADALVSEFDIRSSGDVWLYTIPAGERGSIPVRLGHNGFEEKLERLTAFWHRAVLPQPHKKFNLIDLRFDGQIVTQEETVGGQLSAAQY